MKEKRLQIMKTMTKEELMSLIDKNKKTNRPMVEF